ncbi:IucA/IucC family protein [Herbaspirillum sp. alder98]|uniref:IucA/IucC family protein n=1 Tax=Herbaspirillum sp. alder98 TaxID=2913096 RepID=UPI001CD8B19C|nr:IucA/IucC family siderophore biosynthesis protein [Herbaspirillum sp. alder98]MCA1323915.1 IucA/IucC family siderophore biosynthesis protein [Herbaspirillum sp. alder98]
MTLHDDATHPGAIAAHLTPEAWASANRMLLRKALAEYAHEMIIAPETIGAAATPGMLRYRLSLTPAIEYHFDARQMALRHWDIAADSIICLKQQRQAPLDALQFVTELRDLLAIDPARLPIYLDEITSTLHSAAYKLCHCNLRSTQLAQAGFQEIEASMTEGHPSFVANNGRLGFDAHDYHAYAPEAGIPIRLVWVAVHRDHAHFACVPELDHDALLREELGQPLLDQFHATLKSQGCDPAHYYLMPAHPWQWFNKLALAFAPYLADRRMVCLGYGADHYRAQQSIRTLFNLDHPTRRYVKGSLSILNMGFMRGLSPYYMAGTPAINAHIHGLLQGDAYLRGKGFGILREVASLGFRHRYYEGAISGDSPYKKMFSALWRENPLPLIGPGQRLMTMAALLHVDQYGDALVVELVRASALDPMTWLQRYLEAYLAPLVHCLYRHDLVFMPHGENLILVLEDHVPVRVFMKDIAEESAILDPDAELPDAASRLRAEVPDRFRLLSIFVDVFDGFLRHLSPLLSQHLGLDEDDFWRIVAACISGYQRTHPQQLSRYRQFDLFAPSMLHSCLNRLQLANNLQMVNLADPVGSFRLAADLVNPIARHRPRWLDPCGA